MLVQHNYNNPTLKSPRQLQHVTSSQMARHGTSQLSQAAFSKQYLEGVENENPKEKTTKGLRNFTKCHEMSPELQWFRILGRRETRHRNRKQYMQGARGSWPQRPSSQSGQIGSLSLAPSEEWPSLPLPNLPTAPKSTQQRNKHPTVWPLSQLHAAMAAVEMAP